MPLPCVQKTVCVCSVVFHLQCRVQQHLAFLLSFWRSLLILPGTSCYCAVGRKWRQPLPSVCTCSQLCPFRMQHLHCPNDNIALRHTRTPMLTIASEEAGEMGNTDFPASGS